MSTVHFSDILMILKNIRLKSCERIYTIDFSLKSFENYWGGGSILHPASFHSAKLCIRLLGNNSHFLPWSKSVRKQKKTQVARLALYIC